MLDQAAAAVNAARGLEGDERGGSDAQARLCLNWHNDVVRRLLSLDGDVFASTVRLLYIQALLGGQRPLREHDRLVMTGALATLIDRSVAPPAM